MSKLTMNNVAAMTVQYSRYSFDYTIDSLAKCGIMNVEMWQGEPHYYRGDFVSGEAAARKIRELKAKMDDKGLKVVMYTPETLVYPLNPAGQGAERERTIDLFKMAMEDALEFGTNQLFCNSGCGLYDESRDAAWARAVDTFQRVAAHAKAMGVEMVLEQLQPYESNLVLTSSDVQKMMDDVGYDNFNCCLDLGAMAVAGEQIQDFYDKFPTRIKHVHFSDANHEIPGDRDLPLAEYVKTFEEKDYTGYLSLEVNDTIYLDDPHAAFMKSAEYMRKLLGE